MLTVHHLGVSQSDRIVWLCEELEVPYTLIRYDRDAATGLAPADYKALHPSGTAPVIEDDGLVLAESAAIIDYVIAKYGAGRLALGPNDPNFADYLYWFHFAQGSMMPSGMIELIVSMLGSDEKNDVVQSLLGRNDRAYDMVEARLGEALYFAGPEFTAADIIMLFPLTTMRAFVQRDLSRYPNILAYLQRIGERPAYRSAMAKADPDLTPMLT